MTEINQSTRQKLASINQEQDLRFYDALPAAGQAKLANQLAALDLDQIADLAESYVRHKPHLALPKDIQPVKAYPREPGDDAQRKLYERGPADGGGAARAGKSRRVPRRRRAGDAAGV